MPPARCYRPPLDLNSAVAAVKSLMPKTFIESYRDIASMSIRNKALKNTKRQNTSKEENAAATYDYRFT